MCSHIHGTRRGESGVKIGDNTEFIAELIYSMVTPQAGMMSTVSLLFVY